MRVLSLFDGIGCGRVSLEKAGINISCYHTCEISGSASLVAKTNYKDIINFGDVRNFDCNEGDYDILIAGSPCQGFSFLGKGLNFNHPKSSLYFEFLRIFKKLKPKYFLLENVVMKKDYSNIISNDLGVYFKKINSNCYLPQNRDRLYWTNINFDSKGLKKQICQLET